jgi:hypothetical protein
MRLWHRRASAETMDAEMRCVQYGTNSVAAQLSYSVRSVPRLERVSTRWVVPAAEPPKRLYRLRPTVLSLLWMASVVGHLVRRGRARRRTSRARARVPPVVASAGGDAEVGAEGAGLGVAEGVGGAVEGAVGAESGAAVLVELARQTTRPCAPLAVASRGRPRPCPPRVLDQVDHACFRARSLAGARLPRARGPSTRRISPSTRGGGRLNRNITVAAQALNARAPGTTERVQGYMHRQHTTCCTCAFVMAWHTRTVRDRSPPPSALLIPTSNHLLVYVRTVKHVEARVRMPSYV